MSSGGPGAEAHDGAPGGNGRDPVSTMLDMPVALWGEVLRALRRAVDRLPRSELPATLRPYAGWTPDSLSAARPRQVIARVLAEDARLREEVGEALEDREARDAAVEADSVRLAAVHGEETAAAALIVQGRWNDLAVLAARVSDRQASRDRSAAEATRQPELSETEAARRRLSADLAAARHERDAQRRRADAAEERSRREDAARRMQAEELTRLRERVSELEGQLTDERRRRDRRVRGLQRRLEEAAARGRVDETRTARVVAELERLTEELRDALAPSPEGKPPASLAPAGEASWSDEAPRSDEVPRSVTPAAPGRPCRLPPGIGEDTPAAVKALLQTQRLETVLDGYNVTKDARGRPHVTLTDQRHWLVKVCGGVAARYGRRMTVVFDGTEERPAPPPAARGVRVVFTAGEETADERIEGIVAALAREVPVLVVSSDRAVCDAARALGANVVSSGTFLAATGA